MWQNLSRFITVSIMVVMASLFTVSASHAVDITGSLGSPTSNCGHYSVGAHPSKTFMVGDSLTHRGKPYLRELRPHWAITGKHGRDVDCLPAILTQRLTSSVPLKTLVIALGTNATEGWYRTQYQQVVDMLPVTTRIVFVTTYRNPTLWPSTKPFRVRASVQYFYSKVMRQIATTRDNICTVPWRWTAQHHPSLIEGDGVHPYRGKGTTVWAHKVASAVAGCPR